LRVGARPRAIDLDDTAAVRWCRRERETEVKSLCKRDPREIRSTGSIGRRTLEGLSEHIGGPAMSNDDVQYSDDGQWWWDGEEWQPVDGADEGGGDESGGDAGGEDDHGGDEPAEEPVPAFDFDNNGVRVSPEDSPVESEGEPLKIAFAVCNTGNATGSCRVTLWIDNEETEVYWDSPEIEPGQCATPDGDGYVHDVPAQTEGRHLFEVFADPPGEYGGYTSNEIDVGPPEG
jgi:hypothetical protein